MLNIQLARKYARALFELALEEHKLVEYGQELSDVRNGIESVPIAGAFLSNPQVERQAKKELIKKLFEGEVSEDVYHFLLLLVDKRRMSLFPAIVSQYEELSNEARHIVVADVTTARTLSKEQKDKLEDKLEVVTGKTVKVRLHEDPKIIGGVIVRIGDKRIDGSVTGKLSALAGELMATK